MAPPSSPARFLSLLSFSSPPAPPSRLAILAIDPDHFKIPHFPGIPVGKKLKAFNLPPDCDPNELMQWFEEVDLYVDSVEFTNDPDLNAIGVNAILDMRTDGDASMSIVRRDGRKFKGRCVRLDFVEKRPRERDMSGRRYRPRDGTVVDKFEPRSGYRSETGFGDGGGYGRSSGNRIYVGNLPWSMEESGLERLFSAHGTVQDAKVMRDRETGRARGFGFVTMSSAEEMQAAISALNGHQVEGRLLRVNEAQ